MKWRLFLLLGAAIMPAGSPVCAGEEHAPTAPDSPAAEIVKLPGGVTVDAKKKEVRLEAEVCLSEGILEWVLCRPDTFEHESLFVTKAAPQSLHVGLLLIGVKPFPYRDVFWWVGVEKMPKSHVSIEVAWEEGGMAMRVPVHELIVDREIESRKEGGRRKIDFGEDAWVFTGSQVVKQGDKANYFANQRGVLVALWLDPSSVVQYGRRTLNPYQGEDSGLSVNEELCPPDGTEVEIIFSSKKEPIKFKNKKNEKSD